MNQKEHEEGYFYTRLYRLNPLSWLYIAFLLVILPFVSMVTETTIQDHLKDLYKVIVKGRI